MNYTPKPSSRITPSIGQNRMKIRSVDFEFSAFRQTDATERLCFIYIDRYKRSIFIQFVVGQIEPAGGPNIARGPQFVHHLEFNIIERS